MTTRTKPELTVEPDTSSPPGKPPAEPPVWQEEYRGGSPDAERLEFDRFAQDIMGAQLKNRNAANNHNNAHGIERTLHAKATLAVSGELTFRADLAEDLRAGFARPGASYPVTLRFSNAAGIGGPDGKADMRGMAMRVQVSEDVAHDLLATNFPVSHARDAREFVAFATHLSGSPADQALGMPQLIAEVGLPETLRMLEVVRRGRAHTPASIATETYWSRGALTWGPTLAVRYLLRPAPDTQSVPAPDGKTAPPDYLGQEITERLSRGSVRFELCLQRYVDPKLTPIEDTSIEWTEAASPAEPVALLTIPQCDVNSVEARAFAREVETIAFNPWNTTDDFRPLGNLNRARKAVYDASAAHRLGYRFRTDPPLRNRLIGRVIRPGFSLLNRQILWWKLPTKIGLLNLDALRFQLRADNLIDTERREAPPQPRAVPATPADEARVTRSFDGTNNDLSAPQMGAVGATFGRNLPMNLQPELFDEPNPVRVSQELLARKEFIPATTLNLLAAAWIQFQVHDWVDHARRPLGQDDVVVPLPDGERWASRIGGPEEPVMRIAGNVTKDNGETFPNAASHWWDGSEVYGADSAKAKSLRDGPKIRLDGGYLPEDTKGQEITGFNESWWLGLSGMHTLFAREHNVLCDELRAHYPGWSDDRIYHTARLIVTALIAKIHTVEWTPAILATEDIYLGLNQNWSGPQPGDWVTKLGTWFFDEHSSVGITKTMPDHNGVPYSLTEDFVTVYRMHPLIPDDYRFADHRTGEDLGEKSFLDIQGDVTDAVMRATGLENMLYSFGIANPGAITLHNYPASLQSFVRNGNEHVDLAVVDLIRTRRRGVPRYNDFREGLHLPRITRWEDLCADQATVAELKKVYRSIDEVDTMVGLYAETPPPGFGFSDTAFRIFILMASRRLQSDRFFTVDFRPEIYSPFGMDWIANNGMTSVILRHCPELAPVLPRDRSAFVPWRPHSTPKG